MTVELEPEPKEGRLRATVTSSTGVPAAWRIADGRAIEIAALSARDAAGALPVTRGEEADGSVMIRAGRGTVAPVELRYVVTTKPGAPATQGPCRIIVEPDRASFCGEQILALPEDRDEREAVRVRLVPDGTFLRDAASSFGLRDELVTTASTFELESAAFVFGDLVTSELRAPEGRDHAAALGYVSFDPRWVAAEAAGFRTAIDRWLGVARPQTDPSAGLVIVAGSHPERPIQILRRTRGLLLSADVSASFTSGARVRVGQLFAQRTVGGALWLGRRLGPEETRGLWFSEGLSRAVALFALRDLGVLEDADLAADANALLAELALSGSDARSLDELASGARSNDAAVREEAIRALAARGTLVALDLGAADLQKVLRALARDPASARTGEVSMPAFVAAVREAAGDAKATRLVRSIEAGRVAIDKAVLGPCFELGERSVAPFELGFEIGRGADGKQSLLRVTPGSAAARAGARKDDDIVSLDYRPDRADIPVEAAVLRDGKPASFRFLPAGKPRPGRAFIRAARAPRACELP